MIDRMLRVGLGLSVVLMAWLGPADRASAGGRYDPKSGLFYLSYTYASLPNTANDAQALLSAEIPRTPELDALVSQFYQVVSDDLGKVTGGKGYLAPPTYTDDIRKADILISPDTPFTLGGGYRGGWGTLNGFSNNSGQLAIYIQSLKDAPYTPEGQRLTVVHELCHYLFGLPDEYGAQYCPLIGSPGGQGCLMDNYNVRTWPGYLCSNEGNFPHNAGAVTNKDPSIDSGLSCREIVDAFFARNGVDKNARFNPPTGGTSTTPGMAIPGGGLSTDMAMKVMDRTRSVVLDQKAKGMPTDKKSLLRKVAGTIFDLLKASNVTQPTNLESLAEIALEAVGVPPIVPKTLEKFAPLFEAEAKRLAQSLANNSGRGRLILDGLLQFAKAPGSGMAPPPVGDEEYDYLNNLAKQAAAATPSQAVDPANAQLLYLSQISAKLNAILIANNVPGAVDSRDLTRALDAALAKVGKIPPLNRDDPFKKARRTLVIAPPIVVPQFPGSMLDEVIVHPGLSVNYNDLRYQCVDQFDKLIARDRVEPVFGTLADDDSGRIRRTSRLADYGTLVNTDKVDGGQIRTRSQSGRQSQNAVITARKRRIAGLLELVYDGIQKDTIQNIAVLIPPGGLPIELTRRLEELRPLIVGHSDFRLDIVQVGTAPIPRQLRDFASRSDGSVLTVTDQDEVGAVSQRLANDQSQGTWVNLPLQGAIYFEDPKTFQPPKVQPEQLINYTLFQRMLGDRINYPIGKADALPDEVRLALRPFYVDAASSYQFVIGFTRDLNVPSTDNQGQFDANQIDQLTPTLTLTPQRINVEDSEARKPLELLVNRPYREVGSDNLAFDPDQSSTNILVFNLPGTSAKGVSEGWYTPVLTLRKANFYTVPEPDRKGVRPLVEPKVDGTSLHFTSSVGTPRSNGQLIPQLIQVAPADPDSSYLGTLAIDATQAVIQAQMIVGAPVKKAVVTGFFQRIEVGETPILFKEFRLRDDGQAPDKAADDGVYTGVIPLVDVPRYSAEYRVVLAAESQDGTAFIDLAEPIQAAGKQMSTVTNQPVPKFQRATSINFHVLGELGDRAVTAPIPPPAAPAAGPAGGGAERAVPPLPTPAVPKG